MFDGHPLESDRGRMPKSVSLALREVFLIVISVLIAIGLDSLWQDRQDRRGERELLEALHNEMELNSRELERWISLHGRVHSSSAELLRMVRATGPGGTIQVPDTLISDIIRTPTFQPELSVLQTALSSGSIALVQNVNLSRELNRWSRSLEEAQEEELKGLHFVEEQLVPHLLRVVDMEPAQRSLVEFSEAHSLGASIPPRSRSSSDVRADPPLANLLARRIFYADFAVTELRVVQTTIAEILEALDRELR
ncbi:MAG: hypothetical protein JXA57_05770 [Armatimonadetes bacterium]|nr:hypothetical protein [Armatimonadota bacterium]